MDSLTNHAVSALIVLAAAFAASSVLVTLAVSVWDSLGVLRWVVGLAILAGAVGAVLLAVNQRRAAAEEHQRQVDLVRVRAERQMVMDRDFAYTRSLSGQQFEEQVARLLRRDGWADAHVVGGANDRGADVVATRDGEKMVVQCKHYSGHKVTSGDMQRFVGMCYDEHHADIAVFVTTSAFTREARAIGEKRRVVLVDSEMYARWQSYGQAPFLAARA